MRTVHRRAPLLCAALLLAAAPVAAQKKGDTRMFLELGELSAPEDFNFTSIGVRFNSVAPVQPTLDWSLAMAITGGLLGTTDLDLGLPIPAGEAAQIVPRAGVSALVVLAGDSGGGVVGWNYGAGLVLNPRGPLLMRADYTARRLGTGPDSSTADVNSFSVGVGWR